MNNTQQRLVLGLVLVSLAGLLGGCSSSVRLDDEAKPSKIEFDIKFLPNDTQPTEMVITPNDGDAFLEAVKSPGPDDNKITWRSNSQFEIKFMQIDDQTKPFKKKFGDEVEGWNAATKNSNGKWVLKIKLTPGSGNPKKNTIGAKYFVKHVVSKEEFDPVIIVRN